MKSLPAGLLLGAIQGPSLSKEEAAFFRELQPAGLTLFRRNLTSLEETKELCSHLQRIAGDGPGNIPSAISIDQEGGRVARLKGLPFDPGPALQLLGGAHGSKALEGIHSAAFAQGRGLKDLGINVNFAPVCDVLTTTETDCIGDRAFGIEPEGAKLRAHAYLRGLQAAGIYGCLKHFPGQGAAPVDTHKAGSVVDKSLPELLDWDLKPFASLLPEAKLVMLSHCIYPAVDSKEAVRSEVWIKEWLKKKLGFQGLVLSDDMTMGAVNQDEGTLIDCLVAGVDLLLISGGFEAFVLAEEFLRRESDRSPALRARMQTALAAVKDFRKDLIRGPMAHSPNV